MTKAISVDSVYKYICIKQSDWRADPSLPEELDISQLFDITDYTKRQRRTEPGKRDTRRSRERERGRARQSATETHRQRAGARDGVYGGTHLSICGLLYRGGG